MVKAQDGLVYVTSGVSGGGDKLRPKPQDGVCQRRGDRVRSEVMEHQIGRLV